MQIHVWNFIEDNGFSFLSRSVEYVLDKEIP